MSWSILYASVVFGQWSDARKYEDSVKIKEFEREQERNKKIIGNIGD